MFFGFIVSNKNYKNNKQKIELFAIMTQFMISGFAESGSPTQKIQKIYKPLKYQGLINAFMILRKRAIEKFFEYFFVHMEN